jgi:hypothetical protein
MEYPKVSPEGANLFNDGCTDEACQAMLSIAVEAYHAITGREGPEDELGPWPRPDPGPDWDFSDPAELQRRYPRLWACLGNDA